MTLALNVVRLGDRHALGERHPYVVRNITTSALAEMADFPGAGDDFPIFFYLTDDENRVCCYFRTIPDQLTFDDTTYRWAWTGDNFTEPEMRGRGLSTQLQRKATAFLHNMEVGRGSVWSTEVTLHIFSKLSFVQPGYAARHLLLRDAGPFLDAHINSASLRAMARAAAWPVAKGSAAILRAWNDLRSRGMARPESTAPEGPQVTSLLDRLRDRSAVRFHLDPDHMSRKLKAAARVGPTTLYLARSRRTDHRANAYFVVREREQDEPLADRYRGFRLMTLMDYGFEPDDDEAPRSIVAAVLKLFFQSRCAVLETISNHPGINSAARASGMLSVGKGISFAYSVPERWDWPERMKALDAWPVTRFRGDAYTF